MAKYGPQRIAAFTALWRAIVAGNRPGTPGLGDRMRAVPRMLRGALTGTYDGVDKGRLLMLLLAVGYLVSPVDLVPELVLGLFGLGDDAVVALWLGGALLVETERFLNWERSRPQVVDAPVR